MTLEFLDFNSYTFAGGFTVQKNRDLIIPESLVLSRTMLVKWQIRNLAKGATIEQIEPAILSSSLEIPGLGILEVNDYQIVPSQTGRDRVQLITLNPSLPYKLVLSDVTDLVTNSVLEFYTSNLTMGTFNNPVQPSVTDLSPIVNAIQSASQAEIIANQAIADAPPPRVEQIVDLDYDVTSWSGAAKNHIALEVDNNRLTVSIFNGTTERIAVDQFLDVYAKAGQPQHNGFIEPGGTFNLGADEAHEGILLYTLNGSNPGLVAIEVGYQTVINAAAA